MAERTSRIRHLLRAAEGGGGKVAVAKVVLKGRVKASTEPVPIAMKDLNGEPVFVRPGTSDLTDAADYLTLGIHFPAPEVAAKNLRADR